MRKITIDPIQLFDAGERIFTVLSLILYMNAVIPLLIIGGASEGDGVDLTAFNFTPLNLLFVLNYLITTSLLILRWQKVLYVLSHNFLFAALTVMIPVSFLWSANPAETMSGSIGMVGTTLFGLYFASRFTLKEQLNLIGWAFGIAIALSLVFIIALPKYGIMGGVHAGTPRGVFTHKNGMGKFMVLSNCVFMLLALGARPGNFYPWLGVIGSIGLIVVSSSTSALLNGTMLALIVLFFGQILKLKPRLLIPVAILSGLGAWAFSTWAIDLATLVLGFFDKDLTLTGRTEIWPAAINKIQERPWLGYGFNGFWHDIRGESADIIRTVRWNVGNSHNGFLDLILQLGLVGFVVFILIAWTTLVKSCLIVQNDFRWEYLWPVVFLMYIFLINFAESTLMSQNDFFWILFTSIVFSTAIEFKRVFGQSTAQTNALSNHNDLDLSGNYGSHTLN
ncbi:MAG: O-antigen ligase family protein [Nodosilinea sp.]